MCIYSLRIYNIQCIPSPKLCAVSTQENNNMCNLLDKNKGGFGINLC